jgi:uncharacterized protein DUF4395
VTKPRTADPYRDLDVIDERAPRTNQAIVFGVALVGVAFGWPLAWALMALQLLVGLAFGRRFCLPCLAYFELIQPRIGEGRLEDSRPPRLANQMGFAFLAAAATAWWLGAETLGVVLASIVAALALLAALSGFCTGCELYKVRARLRGISARHHDRIDPADVGGFPAAERTIVQFTHPICSECREWDQRLEAAGAARIRIDVRELPALAEKYGIAVVPTIYAVDRDGAVLEQLA